jgi:hypothetical protein
MVSSLPFPREKGITTTQIPDEPKFFLHVLPWGFSAYDQFSVAAM